MRGTFFPITVIILLLIILGLLLWYMFGQRGQLSQSTVPTLMPTATLMPTVPTTTVTPTMPVATPSSTLKITPTTKP